MNDVSLEIESASDVGLETERPSLVELDSGTVVEVDGGAAGTAITQKTTQEWAAYSGTESVKGHLYVYTDYYTDSDGKTHPGLKIGDGKAYIGDLPVTGLTSSDVTRLIEHINDKTVHITQEEREAWSKGVSVEEKDDTLIIKYVKEK